MSSYATLQDLYVHGLPGAALSGMLESEQQAALDAASTLADGYLRNKFTLPVITPSLDLVMAVCQIAAWNLLRRRGFNPEGAIDATVRQGYEDAVSWLKRVSDGTTTPMLTDSSGAPAGKAVGGAFAVQPQPTGQLDSGGFPLISTGAPRQRGW